MAMTLRLPKELEDRFKAVLWPGQTKAGAIVWLVEQWVIQREQGKAAADAPQTPAKGREEA